MALTLQGNNTSQTTTVTIPTHAIGDLIVIYAYRSNSTTVPTKPSAGGTVPAWVDIDAATGANSCSSRTAYFVATATNHTSGTWTSATSMIAVVLRGQHTVVPIGGHSESGGTGTTMTAPSISMANADGSGQLLHFFGGVNLSSWGSAASGYTLQASSAASGASAGFVTKNTTTSDGAVNQGTQASSTGYRGATVEIIPVTTTQVLYSATGAGFAVSLVSSGSWNHTASNGDTVIVDVYPDRGFVTGVTYGGTAMKKLGLLSYPGGSGNGVFNRYIMYNVSSGTASVAFTLSTSAWVTGNSVSYQNAQSVDIPTITTNSVTTMSQTATVPTGYMAVQSFSAAGVTLTGHTGGTNRVRIGSGGFATLEINDASASDTFSSTISSSKAWGAIESIVSPNAPSGVYYDNVGAGYVANVVSSGSWNHTATSGAYVVVDLCITSAVTVTSMTYDGNAMTLLGMANFNSGSGTLFRYGISNVASGTKTVSFTLNASGWATGSSTSIMGVGAVSSTTPVSGSSSSPTQGASCQPGQIIIQAFGSTSNMTTLTGGANLYTGQTANSDISQSIAGGPTTFNSSVTGATWGGLVTVLGPTGSVFPPNPPYIIGSAMSTTNTVTLPTHQPGDLIIISAFNNASTTTPTMPAAAGTVPAWVDIDNNTGANSCALRTAYYVATASNHTSGTWTNATTTGAIVYRGAGAIPIGGHAESGGTGTGSVAPAVTLSNGDGSSAILEIHATRTSGGLDSTAPAGYTRRVADPSVYCAMNTKDDSTSDGSVTQTGTSSTGYRGATIEIVGFTGPIYDNVGAGGRTRHTSLSWTHVGAVGAYAFTAIELSNVASTVTVTACTYGGTNMVLLGSQRMNNDNTSAGGMVYLYGLGNIAGGSKTVSVTISNNAKAIGNSVSYLGVTMVAPTLTNYGQGTSLTQAVSISAGQRIVQTFGAYPSGGGGGLTPSGGFNRYNANANSGQSNLTISDTIVPTTFSATSGGSATWTGIAAVMSIYNGAFFPFLRS